MLYYRLPNGDSVQVDQVNIAYDPGTNLLKTVASDVAGIEQATTTHILVRKANIDQGNLDWNDARGADILDSEWLPIPYQQGRDIYTTVKTHGDFSIVLNSSNIDVNEGDQVMNVPWGIYKYDSIMDEFELGPGMAWQYQENTTSVEDSTHTIARTGDTLIVYAAGADLEEVAYHINVVPPENDMTLVFPRSYLVSDELAALNDWEEGGFWLTPYYVTEDQPVIDTIGDVPFATRVDTLQKYLEKAPLADWEIVWVDGNERVDLKNGDILKVTAENGTDTKDYYIDVEDLEGAEDISLSAIIWPDKTEFLEGWREDTVPGFNPTRPTYNITLPIGTMNVPALVAIPTDMNAEVMIDRATSLTGGQEERTTIFTVTAEDGTTVKEYSVTFVLEKDWSKVQKFYGEPFISELIGAQSSWISYVEIVNPRNVPLDMSQYVVVRGDNAANYTEIIGADIATESTLAQYRNRYAHTYVPGYRYYDDYSTWQVNRGLLVEDFNVDPVKEPGDVFILGKTHAGRINNIPAGQEYLPDIMWHDVVDTSVTAVNTVPRMNWLSPNYFLVKIRDEKLDSILNGNKAVGADITDYEIVDAFGDFTSGQYEIAGRVIPGGKGFTYVRKPHIYKGVPDLLDGMGTDAETSDWIVKTYAEDVDSPARLSDDLDNHTLDPVTVYMSTVSSLVYLVSDGFEGDGLTIQGDLSGLTVSGFMDNLIKPDTGQVQTVMNAGDKAPEDAVADGDTLKVVSADGNNTTMYTLVDMPLDDDALIMVKSAYTGSYSVNVDGSSGTITGSGVNWGVPVKEIMAALIFPDLATYSIIDKENKLVPLQVRNFDGVLSDVRINDSIFIEVRAQDGSTIITYQLKPESDQSDAFVVSSIFLVD